MNFFYLIFCVKCETCKESDFNWPYSDQQLKQRNGSKSTVGLSNLLHHKTHSWLSNLNCGLSNGKTWGASVFLPLLWIPLWSASGISNAY